VIHSVPTENSRRYFLCFGASLPAATGGWNPQAGVLTETRACVSQPANTIAEVSRLLSTATPIQGRVTQSQIFHPTKFRKDVTEIKVMLFAYYPAGVCWFDNIRIEPVTETPVK